MRLFKKIKEMFKRDTKPKYKYSELIDCMFACPFPTKLHWDGYKDIFDEWPVKLKDIFVSEATDILNKQYREYEGNAIPSNVIFTYKKAVELFDSIGYESHEGVIILKTLMCDIDTRECDEEDITTEEIKDELTVMVEAGAISLEEAQAVENFIDEDDEPNETESAKVMAKELDTKNKVVDTPQESSQ